MRLYRRSRIECSNTMPRIEPSEEEEFGIKAIFIANKIGRVIKNCALQKLRGITRRGWSLLENIVFRSTILVLVLVRFPFYAPTFHWNVRLFNYFCLFAYAPKLSNGRTQQTRNIGSLLFRTIQASKNVYCTNSLCICVWSQFLFLDFEVYNLVRSIRYGTQHR